MFRKIATTATLAAAAAGAVLLGTGSASAEALDCTGYEGLPVDSRGCPLPVDVQWFVDPMLTYQAPVEPVPVVVDSASVAVDTAPVVVDAAPVVVVDTVSMS